MSRRRLIRPEQYFIDNFLTSSKWDETETVGFDPGAATGTDAFLPHAPSLDRVGEYYPNLIVQNTNETSGGESTYDFVTNSGPGQNRTGTLLVTARAEDRNGDGYTSDAGTYTAITADELVARLIAEVEDICLDHPQGGTTDFAHLGSNTGADVPDNQTAPDTVRQEQCTVSYSWVRAP